MTLLLAAVMGLVTGAMLPVANLMRHLALSAGLFAIVMIRFATIMLRRASVVPVVLTLLVFHLALSVLAVPEMFPVMVGRRMFAVMVWRWAEARVPRTPAAAVVRSPS